MGNSVPESAPPAPLGSTYTSRPTSITAIQWDGTEERSREIHDWARRTRANGAVIDTDHIRHLWDHDAGVYVMPNGQIIHAPYTVRCLIISTLEGNMVAEPGWWIIQGTEGEFYPCKDSVFQRKYQKAEAEQ
jgi:hypothetical protein